MSHSLLSGSVASMAASLWAWPFLERVLGRAGALCIIRRDGHDSWRSGFAGAWDLGQSQVITHRCVLRLSGSISSRSTGLGDGNGRLAFSAYVCLCMLVVVVVVCCLLVGGGGQGRDCQSRDRHVQSGRGAGSKCPECAICGANNSPKQTCQISVNRGNWMLPLIWGFGAEDARTAKVATMRWPQPLR